MQRLAYALIASPKKCLRLACDAPAGKRHYRNDDHEQYNDHRHKSTLLLPYELHAVSHYEAFLLSCKHKRQLTPEHSLLPLTNYNISFIILLNYCVGVNCAFLGGRLDGARANETGRISMEYYTPVTTFVEQDPRREGGPFNPLFQKPGDETRCAIGLEALSQPIISGEQDRAALIVDQTPERLAILALRGELMINELGKQAAEFASRHDAMTGCLNRKGLYEKIEDLETTGETNYRLAFVDLNDLKGLNDGEGHEEGDAAICAIAGALKALADGESPDKREGEKAHIARLGGDEFAVIIMPSSDLSNTLTDEGLSEEITDRVTDFVDGSRQRGDLVLSQNPSISVGTARRSEHDSSSETLRVADIAMQTRKDLYKIEAFINAPRGDRQEMVDAAWALAAAELPGRWLQSLMQAAQNEEALAALTEPQRKVFLPMMRAVKKEDPDPDNL
ncbi:hypothetical protein CR970_00255 [Candidatus Saccharibacteria bacterium]|nr:MAG: hypothetical protein CR970_00255 [Candidatus Saccharibacteria bacterium]